MKKVILGLVALLAIMTSTVTFAASCAEQIVRVVCDPALPNTLTFSTNDKCVSEFQNSDPMTSQTIVGAITYTFKKDEFGTRCERSGDFPTECGHVTGLINSTDSSYAIFRDTGFLPDFCPDGAPIPPPIPGTP